MSEWFELKEAEFNTALTTRDVNKMRDLFNTVPTVDLAEFADNVKDPSTLTFIFKVVKSELTADFFTELNDETQEKLLRVFSDDQLVELINKSYTDDIVDVLEDMPANLVNRALKFIPKEKRESVNKLLNFKEDTASSIMTTEYFELNGETTVEDAMKQIREKGKQAETIYTVFLRDEKRNLTGTVDLDDLIFADPKQTLNQIKNKEFIYTKVGTDQEEVARIFKKYDLNALAVVNNEHKLVGVITVDDIMDVMEKESSEDIARLNKVADMETPYLETKISKLVIKCVPWIIILMILQLFSTMILSSFQVVIAQVAVLSVFTPLLMDAGGNSGGQTTTIIVRSLALGEFDKKDIKKVIWKEFRVAVCIAGIVAIFAFGWIMFEIAVGIVKFEKVGTYHDWTWTGKTLISLLVASTLFVTMIVSRMVGCLLPFGAKLIKQDPAVLCGPITTTIVDIVTLLTYFLLWQYAFSPILERIATL